MELFETVVSSFQRKNPEQAYEIFTLTNYKLWHISCVCNNSFSNKQVSIIISMNSFYTKILQPFRQQTYKSLFMVLLKNSSLLAATFQQALISFSGPTLFFLVLKLCA